MDANAYINIPEYAPPEWRNNNDSSSVYMRPATGDVSGYGSKANYTTLSAETVSGADGVLSDAILQLRLVMPEDLDPETADNWYFGVIDGVRGTEGYYKFLEISHAESATVREALLIYLANIDYENTSRPEELYLYRCLFDKNTIVKEIALNTLLEWDDFFNYSILADVRFDNKILNNDLREFLEAHEG